MIGFIKFVALALAFLLAVGASSNSSDRFKQETFSNVRILLSWLDKWIWIVFATGILAIIIHGGY